ncbi:putative lipoprotein YbaY/heat shock protein HslJ [Paucibacter oligotrophus]|uniref:Putative lipoprotein YbaY/heat shock protein HslJ n=1 Tax=Roseateles oligotrophus TaxID=1769250 RepID=A0A840L8B3_9BURK|nr:YbaY family lipoprotein [Roseateles oligotrophus]MBB4844316.1 putative lipoprotein YbaY/heat shock protein HslJ [Roseateles oligotrophus]
MTQTPHHRFALAPWAGIPSCLGLGLVGALLLGLAGQAQAQAQAQGTAPAAKQSSDQGMLTVEGTVAYRQRIAMPPQAVLQVQVADVSLMDAPAKVLAESREEFAGRQVPLRFSLQVPRSAIDERHRYAVSARIMMGDRLAFISTEHHAVLTQGYGNKTDLMLQAVGAAPEVAKPAPAQAKADRTPPALIPTQPSFALPASFTGVLPCADCAGIAQTLTLRADGLYRMRSVYLGKDGAPRSEQGRWMAEAGGGKLVLQGASTQQMWAVGPDKQDKSGAALRLLDLAGKPIVSRLNYELRRTAQVDEISEPLNWQGEFVLQAGAARFSDCVSGLSWPLAMGGDLANLQRSHGQFAKAPGAPVLVKLQGRLLTSPGPDGKAQEQLQVDKFMAAEASGARCEALKPGAEPRPGAAAGQASLTETYWKLIELDGQKPPAPAAQQREVQITLHKQNQRVSGSSGCNRLMGSFKQEGAAGLSFSRMAGTMMACSPQAMDTEQKVHAMLAATSAYRIEGEHLVLLSGRRVLARFESVYLR